MKIRKFRLKSEPVDAFQYGIDKEPVWFKAMLFSGKAEIFEHGVNLIEVLDELDGTHYSYRKQIFKKGYFIVLNHEGDVSVFHENRFLNHYEEITEKGNLKKGKQ